MTIDEKAVEILRATFPEWSVLCEDWFNADRAIEKLRPPYAVFLLPTGGRVVARNGRTKDNEDVAVAFLTHVPKGANGQDNIDAYNAMKQAARLFVEAINADGYFEPVEAWEYTTIYEELADITTGVLLSVTLQEARGRC